MSTFGTISTVYHWTNTNWTIRAVVLLYISRMASIMQEEINPANGKMIHDIVDGKPHTFRFVVDGQGLRHVGSFLRHGGNWLGQINSTDLPVNCCILASKDCGMRDKFLICILIRWCQWHLDGMLPRNNWLHHTFSTQAACVRKFHF